MLEDGPKRAVAATVLAARPTISVQVLNECLLVCRRRLRLDWDRASEFVDDIRGLCHVVPVTAAIHLLGRAAARRYQLQVYDAMIVGAALDSDCDTLLSEDMQDGLVIDRTLTVRNPFA